MLETISFVINIYVLILLRYGTIVIIFFIGVYFGLKIIKNGIKLLKKILNKQRLDKTLTKFLMSIVESVLKVLLFLSLVQYVGIPTTSFVAIFGAASLAIGMALSGTLQNFAGGAMLLAFRPFKVGDYVELAGHSGTVEEIQIFNTVLNTPDNKKIIIPNAECSNSSMVNYSATGKRRVDLTIGVGYGDDIDKVKDVLKKILKEENRIIDLDDALIAVSNLGDNSVDFTVRMWVKAGDYWGVYFHTLETIKKTFDKEGISFPFPQRDVHIYNEK